MPFPVGSNFTHHISDPSARIVRRCYINSNDYSQQVTKWPAVSRDWNSIRPANVSIELSNSSRLFNFFTADKTRLQDTVDVDYGVSYQSHNLLQYSNVFSGTGWSKLGPALLLPDAVANPIDGEVDAWKLYGNTSVNTRHYIYQRIDKPIHVSSDAVWALFRAKSAESKALRLEMYFGGGNPGWSGFFDVESGQVLGVSDTGSRGQQLFMRQETNGWWRCGLKLATEQNTFCQMALELTNPSSKTQYQFTNNGSDGIYIHGGQMQIARYAESTRYFMTDSAAAPPWGMNLAIRTHVLSGTNWTKNNAITLTQSYAQAPDGTTTAIRAVSSGFGSIYHDYTLSSAERGTPDYYTVSCFGARDAVSSSFRVLALLLDVNSANYNIGHQVQWHYDTNTVGLDAQYYSQAGNVSSGMSWISVAGAEEYGDWTRLWVTVKNPIRHSRTDVTSSHYSVLRGYVYANGTAPYSGSSLLWGYQIDKGGRELLDGPRAYRVNSGAVPLYPSNAEDLINLFDGTIRDANFGNGKLKLQAKDKLRYLSERIVGTGETPVAINSITPSWLAFTLCSCYGGLSAVQSTSNPDIDWSAVDSWDSYNTANNVHVKTDLRGLKVTEAMKRLSRMTRVAFFIEEDRITVRRWTTVDTHAAALGNTDILGTSLSVNDQDLVNKQWIFGDYNQASDYYAIALYDEDTVSQSSFGLHENIIKDQSIYYVTSGAALDTAQRIITNESQPIDRINVSAIPTALPMQIGETISVTDPGLGIAGSYRIMGSKIDMNRDIVTFDVDNSQLILGNPFTLDTSSLGGTDILT